MKQFKIYKLTRDIVTDAFVLLVLAQLLFFKDKYMFIDMINNSESLFCVFFVGAAFSIWILSIANLNKNLKSSWDKAYYFGSFLLGVISIIIIAIISISSFSFYNNAERITADVVSQNNISKITNTVSTDLEYSYNNKVMTSNAEQIKYKDIKNEKTKIYVDKSNPSKIRIFDNRVYMILSLLFVSAFTFSNYLMIRAIKKSNSKT